MISFTSDHYGIKFSQYFSMFRWQLDREECIKYTKGLIYGDSTITVAYV